MPRYLVQASYTTAAAAAEPTGLACEVTDIGGVDDKGFKTLTEIGFEGLVVEALRDLRRGERRSDRGPCRGEP